LIGHACALPVPHVPSPLSPGRGEPPSSVSPSPSPPWGSTWAASCSQATSHLSGPAFPRRGSVCRRATRHTEERRMKRVLAIILGGGAGTRLYPLTKLRAKPAVPLGAKYRFIDIPINNCINSEIHRIYVLTQFNSASLNRHIARTYALAGAGFSHGFVELLAAQQTPDSPNWFEGTADAVRQYLGLFAEWDVDQYLIL